MKKIFTLSLFFLVACTVQAQMRYFKGVLQGSQSGTASPGTGVIIVRYNMATKLLEHFGNYRNLQGNRTNQHIHTSAPEGPAGSVVVPLTGTGTTAGKLSGSQVLTAKQEGELLAGFFYTNIHSTVAGGGEIRAQLTETTTGQTEFMRARIQGAQQVPPDSSLAVGTAHAILDKSTHQLYVTGEYSALQSEANNAHIHLGAPGIAGPVIIPLNFVAATAGSLDTIVTVNATDEGNLIGGNTYVNIHSTTFQNGEIRGQLTKLNSMWYFAGSLSGAKEVPANGSVAKGTVIVKYDAETNLFELVGDYQNLSDSISGSHVHGPATDTTNASVVFPITNQGGFIGTLTKSITINEVQEADLLAGKWYVNVHSKGTFGGGEIRTMLLPTTPGETQILTANLQASQSVSNTAIVSSGVGSAVVLLDKFTRTVFVTAAFTGLSSNINNAHIHGGRAGKSGGVVVPLSFAGTTSGTLTGSATVRQTFADSMINGFSYVNIHTSNYGSGEIRGQLGDLVLPVKLEYFNGFKDHNQVVLIWQSAQEVNVKNYEVEQQNEAGEWIKKGTVAASGGSLPMKYRFTDLPLVSGKDYVLYRLKSIDMNGSESYSSIIRVTYTKSGAVLTILQNPVINGSLVLTVTGLRDNAKAEVTIVDFNGRLMKRSIVSSFLRNTIDISNLASGMYKLVVKLNDTVLQQSFSKQ